MRTTFTTPFKEHILQGDRCGAFHPTSPPLVMLHGAGTSSRHRFHPLQQILLRYNIASAGVDFIGHGDTSGKLSKSSLKSRTEQALSFIQNQRWRYPRQPLAILGASMGAYNAIMLTRHLKADTLILVVPAAYHPAAYEIPFGPEFSQIIRRPLSWDQTDAWQQIQQFRGKLLIVTAEKDQVIPGDIPEKLAVSATQAELVQTFTVQSAPHKLFDYLNDQPLKLLDLASRINRIMHVSQPSSNSNPEVQ